MSGCCYRCRLLCTDPFCKHCLIARNASCSHRVPEYSTGLLLITLEANGVVLVYLSIYIGPCAQGLRLCAVIANYFAS